MSQLHWVRISAARREDIVALREQDVELFRATVKQRSPQQWVVDGLLSREQIEQVTQQGYKVFVRQPEIQAVAKATNRHLAMLQSLEQIATQGYLTVSAIEQAMQLLAQTYPSLCEVLDLPHKTHEDRRCHALRISTGPSGAKPGLLLLGGAHARELVNPDLLLFWVRELCESYTTQKDIVLGDKKYRAEEIRAILDQLDLFVFPLINPDGRAYVQVSNGNPMWRKNRNPNPGMFCEGVDLNRNYDFLWSSGIGTSDNSCSDVFRGTAAFSEPETQNVQFLVDTLPKLRCVVDVHSYSELIMYPWGDDDIQSIDPTMNFRNDSYQGMRGILGDDRYKEYIPDADLQWYIGTGNRIQEAIAAVRGREYTVGPSADLYPTTGTAGDYPYARTFLSQDAGASTLYSFTIETGREFQPPMTEAQAIISEVSSGLFALCQCLL